MAGGRVDPGDAGDTDEAFSKVQTKLAEMAGATAPPAEVLLRQLGAHPSSPNATFSADPPSFWDKLTTPAPWEQEFVRRLISPAPWEMRVREALAHLMSPSPAASPAPSSTSAPATSQALPHIEEKDDHFLVHGATGAFPVPKDGLGKDTLAHLQGMAHASAANPRPLTTGAAKIGLTGTGDAGDSSALAPATDGQEVAHLADGGEVQPDAGFRQPDFAPLAPFGATDAGAPGGLPFAFTPGGAIPDPMLAGVSPDAAAASAQVSAGYHSLPAPPPPPTDIMGPGMLKGVKEAAPEATAPPPPPPPPSGLPLPPSGSGALTELNKGLAEQRAGLQMQAEAEKARDAALVQLQDQHIAQMQALEVQQAEQLAGHQRRADDLFMAVQNGRIDPNRVWANADLGQRIGAGIGILLSGIGQGLAGGPNLALQQIDRTIDRDIDAQKVDLANKQNLLTHYLQQGRDMMAAQQLAKADLKDLFAAQMLKVSAEFGGQEAAARAQLAGGQLRTEAATKRQEILGRDFMMAKERLSMQLAQEQNRLMGAFLTQKPAPGGGIPADESVWEMMPKDMRERRVRLPGGGWALASDREQAGKVAEGLRVADELKRNLQRYTQLHQQGSPRIPSGLGGDAAAAQQIYGTLTAKLKDMEKLGAISKSDYELIDRQIPDITEWTTSNTSMEQKLNELGRAIDDAVSSQLKGLGVQ